MHRVIAIAVAGASLAGCSSFSMDYFKSAPPPVQVQLESVPSGADATTSVGPGCKTPCSVSVPAPDGFHRHLRDAQVPAGHGSGPGDPDARRFHQPRHRHGRSQSRCGGTPTRRPAAARREEADAAEEAEAAQGRSCRTRRSIAVPDPVGAASPAAAARALIGRHCTAPARTRIVGRWQRAYIVLAEQTDIARPAEQGAY